MTFVAAGVAPPFLVQSVALLVAGAAIAYVCYRLGLVPIVGFLVAGVVIGPHALGLVSDLELVNAAAEVGVILLLFTIGIEFSLEKLARIKRLIFGGGGLQVALATLVTVGLLLPFGVDWRAALFTGFLVSLSSTAIVLKLLADRGETTARHGQAALGLLIFQDLAIIIMVLVVPMLAGTGGSAADIAVALGTALALIALVLVVARRLMPPLLERVARTCSPELFLLTVIAICFGTAYVTSVAGVSLSLGAFLAGLVVSESRFSHHAFGEIMPLQILFSATFFVSVGMLLDLAFLASHLPLVIGAVIVVLVVKVVTTGVSIVALGYPAPVAAATALTLAQIGEFSFVLDRAGQTVGLSPAGLGPTGSQTFIAATVALMVVTPQLTAAGTALAARMTRRGAVVDAAADETALAGERFSSLADHVLVAGYGQAARRLVPLLRDAGIPFVITTLSPGGANEAEAAGLPVLRGDSSRQHTLLAAGVDRARLVVIADDDPAVAHRIVAVAREVSDARLVVRTRYLEDVDALRAAGAHLVIAELPESVVQLYAEALGRFGRSAADIEAGEVIVRRDDYALLRDMTGEGAPGAGANVTAPAPAGSEVDPERLVTLERRGDGTCPHVESARPVQPSARGCEECLRSGDSWVHLRICMSCGHVGCCDSSRNKHATRHHRATGHPIVKSLEPGEDWAWCYVDEVVL